MLHPACSCAPCSQAQEKFDHIGIVATIVGTPITALMVRPHDCCLAGSTCSPWLPAARSAAALILPQAPASASTLPLAMWLLPCPLPQAQEGGHVPTPMLYITGGLLAAAFLPPAPRVA